MTDRTTYHLVLRAEKSDVEPIYRLRRLLKYALRGCGLRCVSVEEVKPDAQSSQVNKSKG